MKCESGYCQRELTNEEEKINREIAEKTKSKKLNYCDACWADYCDHAISGGMTLRDYFAG